MRPSMVPRGRPKKKGPRPLEPTSQVAKMLAASDRHQDAPGAQMSNLLKKVHTIWRLVREHARIKGMASEGERLKDALGLTDMDAGRQQWYLGSRVGRARLAGHPLMPLLELLPFILPPGSDEVLSGHWVEAMMILGEDMGIPGDELEAAMEFRERVTPWELDQWEETLCQQGMDELARRGAAEAARKIAMDYGLTHIEAGGIVLLAKTSMVTTGVPSVEEARALLHFRLERLYSASSRAQDHNLTLKVLKTQAVVLGVTRSEADDDGREFLRAIAQETRKPQLPNS